MPAQTVIKVRRDIAANWISIDPILASGEIGFETDTNKLKIGNGNDLWSALSYAGGSEVVVKTSRHEWQPPYDYIGTAPTETLESSNTWSLTRIEVFADGATLTTTATDSWDNRVTAVYS